MEKPIVFCGISGSGKSFMQDILLEHDNFFSVISHTTRSIRVGEKDSVDYYYVSNNKFDVMKRLDKFIEFNDEVYGKSYGTSYDALSSGVNVPVLVLEPEGAKLFHKKLMDKERVEPFLVFIKCSEKKQKERLNDRGCDPSKERVDEENEWIKKIEWNHIIESSGNTPDDARLIIANMLSVYQSDVKKKYKVKP
jgi:guanylate kinase